MRRQDTPARKGSVVRRNLQSTLALSLIFLLACLEPSTATCFCCLLAKGNKWFTKSPNQKNAGLEGAACFKSAEALEDCKTVGGLHGATDYFPADSKGFAEGPQAFCGAAKTKFDQLTKKSSSSASDGQHAEVKSSATVAASPISAAAAPLRSARSAALPPLRSSPLNSARLSPVNSAHPSPSITPEADDARADVAPAAAVAAPAAAVAAPAAAVAAKSSAPQDVKQRASPSCAGKPATFKWITLDNTHSMQGKIIVNNNGQQYKQATIPDLADPTAYAKTAADLPLIKLSKYNGMTWKRAKTEWKDNKDELVAYGKYRQLVVNTLLLRISVGVLKCAECEFGITGSNDPTSDYDVSLRGPQRDEAVRMFNCEFETAFATSSSDVFDANIYAASFLENVASWPNNAVPPCLKPLKDYPKRLMISIDEQARQSAVDTQLTMAMAKLQYFLRQYLHCPTPYDEPQEDAQLRVQKTQGQQQDVKQQPQALKCQALEDFRQKLAPKASGGGGGGSQGSKGNKQQGVLDVKEAADAAQQGFNKVWVAANQELRGMYVNPCVKGTGTEEACKEHPQLQVPVFNMDDIQWRNRLYADKLQRVYKGYGVQPQADQRVCMKVQRAISVARMYGIETYWSVGAYLHVVAWGQEAMDKLPLPPPIFLESFLENFGSLIEVLIEAKHKQRQLQQPPPQQPQQKDLHLPNIHAAAPAVVVVEAQQSENLINLSKYEYRLADAALHLYQGITPGNADADSAASDMIQATLCLGQWTQCMKDEVRGKVGKDRSPYAKQYAQAIVDCHNKVIRATLMSGQPNKNSNKVSFDGIKQQLQGDESLGRFVDVSTALARDIMTAYFKAAAKKEQAKQQPIVRQQQQQQQQQQPAEQQPKAPPALGRLESFFRGEIVNINENTPMVRPTTAQRKDKQKHQREVMCQNLLSTTHGLSDGDGDGGEDE